MNKSSTSPICIIGMHRSGTSMVANILQRCGLVLGSDDKLVGASVSNVAGHFEHRGFLAINEALLKYLGGSWENPPECSPDWEKNPALDELIRDAQLLLKDFADSSHWGWKEPRTTILLPFWKRVIPNLRFVICIRNPLEVAQSLAKRDRLSVSGGAYLWYFYTRSAIRDTAGSPRIVTFYEDYFRDPTVEVNQVATFCHLNVPTDWSVVGQVINSDLRNQSTKANGLLGETAIPSAYKLLYLAARALVHDESVPAANECVTPDKMSLAVGELLGLIDEFSSEQAVAFLQTAMAKTDHEWSVRMMQELAIKDARISELQRDNNRLELFSQAVRQTLAYRIYCGVIKPFTGYWTRGTRKRKMNSRER